MLFPFSVNTELNDISSSWETTTLNIGFDTPLDVVEQLKVWYLLSSEVIINLTIIGRPA